jgi:hypothetical protein
MRQQASCPTPSRWILIIVIAYRVAQSNSWLKQTNVSLRIPLLQTVLISILHDGLPQCMTHAVQTQNSTLPTWSMQESIIRPEHHTKAKFYITKMWNKGPLTVKTRCKLPSEYIQLHVKTLDIFRSYKPIFMECTLLMGNLTIYIMDLKYG